MHLLHPLLVFLCVLSVIYATPCTFTDSKGRFYDLSPSSQCNGSTYKGVDKNGWQYFVDICQEASNPCKNPGQAACQLDQGNFFYLGSLGSQTFSDLPNGGEGVVITYGSGDYCYPINAPRKTVVSISCNPSVSFTVTSVEEKPTCVYNFVAQSKYACPKQVAPQEVICVTPVKRVINAFLVPHSHDDVGWLETIDGYYESAVRHILDTVVENLVAQPYRKFIEVEQAYFHKWWVDPRTTNEQRANVRKLLQNKQFEFIIGGWVMQDEACTTYSADIDQNTQGHQFILDTFGADYNPIYGWQVDPFGPTGVTATLEALMGFKGHIIDRITFSTKDQLKADQGLEFWWNTNPSIGNKTRIFTHILDDNYCQPMLSGFDFESGSEPVTPQNVKERSDQFVSLIQQRVPYYRSPNVLLPWGCDFHFVDATVQFVNMDQIVKYIQEHSEEYGINLKYSLLSEYYEAAMNSGANFPERDATDFMPYADGPDAWWTGYYTSRVALKGLVRKTEQVGRHTETLYATSNVKTIISQAQAYDMLNFSRAAISEVQHHDGVTGTERNPVAQMYRDHLVVGNENSQNLSALIIGHLASRNGNGPSLTNFTTPALNLQNGKTLAVVVYNSLGWTRTEYVRVPLNRNDVAVTDGSGATISSEVHTAVGTSDGKYELFFLATVKPLGFQTYFVNVGALNQAETTTPVPALEDSILENSFLRVTISSSTGTISSILNKKSGIANSVNQNALQYTSHTNGGQNSGAYIFRTDGPAAVISSQPPANSGQGQKVQEVHQVFGGGQSYWKQTVRLYNAGGDANVENFIEIDHQIGVLPGNREVITRFSTNITTNGVTYTDDNGFDTQKRQYTSSLPIAANFFPHVYWSYIEDSKARLTVLSERSHGVSSQSNGAIELMLHRRILVDDGRGVDEPLDDMDVVYPTLRVVYDTPQASDYQRYRQVYSLNYPLASFYGTTDSRADWTSKYQTSYSPLSADLPPNVHLISLKTRDDRSNTLVLRLHHLFAANEDPNFSKPVTINIKELFSGYTIGNFVEMALSIQRVINSNPGLVITLSPKDIRTFQLTLS